MRRRDFIALAGGTVAWPIAVHAQQPGVPVIGLLASASRDQWTDRLHAFGEGLSETGHVEGKNVAIECRWAENQHDRLPGLAADLVRQQVAVIVVLGSTLSVLAAKAATATIPIVFRIAINPVDIGLVASLGRPGGNITGVTTLGVEVGPKQLELLREMVPMGDLARPEGNITGFANSAGATPLGKLLELLKEIAPAVGRAELMFNPDSSAAGGTTAVSQFSEACKALNFTAIVTHVRDVEAIEAGVASLEGEPRGGLILTQDIFTAIHRAAVIEAAARHRVPAVYPFSFFCAEGGLISYGVDVFVGHAAATGYVDRILKGERPSELPVQQPTKLQLVINLKTAKALGITVPASLLARADEVIE